MHVPEIEYQGLKPGMRVVTPDGRRGILVNFRLHETGLNAPGRAVVQFFDSVSGTFHVEGYSITELERSL